MDNTDLGILLMLAFWGSALGGIGLALTWARSKQRKTKPEHRPDQAETGAADKDPP